VSGRFDLLIVKIIKNRIKIPASRTSYRTNPNFSPTMIPLSKPQTISNKIGDEENFQSNNESIASSRSASNASCGSLYICGSDPKLQLNSSVEPDVARSVARLESHESHKSDIDANSILVRVTVRELGEGIESDESTNSSPVLTPSSSTASLKFLGEETPQACKLAIDTSASTPAMPSSEDLTSTVTSNCCAQDQFEGNKAEDERIVPWWRTATLKDSNDITTARQQVDHSKMEYPVPLNGPNLGRVMVYWSPDDEIRMARSRFGRYGQKCRTKQMDIQRATSKISPVVVEAISKPCKIQIDLKDTTSEVKESVPWWKWLVSSLMKICPARIDVSECEEEMVIRNIPGSFEEPTMGEVTARHLPAKLPGISD
jgi:hypothetical protein